MSTESIVDYFSDDFHGVQIYECNFTKPELLLHPNIPLPMHGLSPRAIKGQKWWDLKRREAYANNNYHCYSCGVFADFDTERQRFRDLKLHAHECYDINYEQCFMELKEIVALCPFCHDYIHSGRMNAMYDQGILDEEDCFLIRNRGDGVIEKIKRNTLELYDKRDYIKEWSKWYMVIDGKKYYSKFKDYEEWKQFYSLKKGGDE